VRLTCPVAGFAPRSESRWLCLALASIVVVPLPGFAQEPKEEADRTAQAMDAGDLWRLIRHGDEPDEKRPAVLEAHERVFVFAPTIASRPSTGWNAGITSNVAFVGGDLQTTHMSSASGFFRVSQKKQVLSGIRFSVFTRDDRWFLQGDNRLFWTSQQTYGLGIQAPPTGEANAKFRFVRANEAVYRNVKGRLFLGLGLNFSRRWSIQPGPRSDAIWDESAFVTYSRTHGFAPEHQNSSGTSFGLLFDTRDNALNARRGWLASTTYRTFFKGMLGGDSTWQQLSVDVRTYRNLTRERRQRLAFWFLGDFVAGGAPPYFDLPGIAADPSGRSARGYTEGRYRGRRLLYAEAEYRHTLTRNGLLGFVAFVNGTTLGHAESGEKLFDAFAPAAGAGFRMLLNKRSRTNLCVDYAWGRWGSTGFYMAIQEAF
jgi:hypothetical protein